MTARGDHARYLLSLVRDELQRTDRIRALSVEDYDRLWFDLNWLQDHVAGDRTQKRMDDELARQREVRARERARGLGGDADGCGEGPARVSVEAMGDHVDQEVVR